MKYLYGMRFRGFSLGCQPMKGFIARRNGKGSKYFDIIVYNRMLENKEIEDYELDFLGIET